MKQKKLKSQVYASHLQTIKPKLALKYHKQARLLPLFPQLLKYKKIHLQTKAMHFLISFKKVIEGNRKDEKKLMSMKPLTYI